MGFHITSVLEHLIIHNQLHDYLRNLSGFTTINKTIFTQLKNIIQNICHFQIHFHREKVLDKYNIFTIYQPRNLHVYMKIDVKIYNEEDDLFGNADYFVYKSVHSLYIEEWYFQPIDNLPSSITHLSIGHFYNQTLDHLPLSIKHLSLGSDFNQLLDKLPPLIETLSVGWSFDKPIDNLPISIIHLSLGFRFNQPIDCLPSNLVFLKLGCNYNKTINHLPSSLLSLRLGYYFNKPLDNLPSSITHLKLKSQYYQSLNNLPSSIRHLSLKFNSYSDIHDLPSSITDLKLDFGFEKLQYIFPTTIKNLTSEHMVSDINELPKILDMLFSQLPNFIHIITIIIYIGHSFNTNLDIAIDQPPSWLKHFKSLRGTISLPKFDDFYEHRGKYNVNLSRKM